MLISCRRSEPGRNRATAFSAASLLLILFATDSRAQVAVSTVQNDNARTAANLAESTLTTSNVGVSQFGKLFSRTVDGKIYAQPLYIPAVSIPGSGAHNIAYVATMHNTIFAFDADDAAEAAPLWQTNLGPAVTVNPGFLPRHDFGPEVGIFSTPVIDPNSKTLFAVALTLVNGDLVFQLHALDIATGQERAASPVSIQATALGYGYDSRNGVITFNANSQLQRTGLLLANGVLYMAFGSYGDTDPYHGWILGYDAATLQQVVAFNATPGGRGGISQPGGGLSADSRGRIYTVTGNGMWDGLANFGQSLLKLNTTAGLSIEDWFTPSNYESLNARNLDSGSSQVLLVPGTNLLVYGSKEGLLYVAARRNLGHMTRGDSQIVQSFGNAGHGISGGLAYWDNPAAPTLYAWGSDDFLKAYQLTDQHFQSVPSSTSQITAEIAAPLSISASGSTPGSGIVWASTSTNLPDGSVAGTLRAFDASDVSKELWNSDQNQARDAAGHIAGFAAPTVANGKVYLSTADDQLLVYGLLPSSTSSTTSTKLRPKAATSGGVFDTSSEVNYITSRTPGLLRNNFSGWVGMGITVGSAQMVVSSLGRFVAPGNTGTHTVKIFNRDLQLDVTGGSVSINTATGTAGTFAYAALASPVTLNANTTYYIFSQETQGGDNWYDSDTTVQTTADATLSGPVFGTAPPYTLAISTNHTFGPIDFVYSSIGVLPVATTLTAAQTQQFTATVTGFSSTNVTWSISPLVGSISGTGLYTAPSPVPANQQITVTATSVADNTRKATAIVTLVPVVVGVTPPTVSLFDSQTQQFSATVANTANTAVTWSISPQSGTISPAGLYTSPATPVVTAQTVTVTATSVADPTKSGSATVTLTPPVAPAITQQPQGISVIFGQTAAFSVAASGGGLTYQWQSKPAGAGSFAAISGATLSSYTTPVTAMTDSGTQFRCVVTNPAGNITSNAATLTVIAPGVGFVTSTVHGPVRNDFTGWVGMSITVAAQPLTVSSLGRYILAGNTGTHTVKIFDVTAGIDLVGGAASVKTAGATASAFAYGALPAPVTLNANATYYILSQETASGDQWYDSATTAQTTNIAVLNGPVFGTTAPYSPLANLAGHMFVPVDFSIPVQIGVAPPTASLFESQTQLFTATVSGNNAAVTWSLSPNTGTISAAGLYTAPAAVDASQTITVSATSVADISKVATATVTLNPATPPVITQQPQGATIFVGQAATFSAVATGVGVSYQWQVMAPGAGSFTNVAGAVSNTYTTAPVTLANSGTQYQCLISNRKGTVTTAAASLTVLTTGATFVTSTVVGQVRNNFTGFVGMSVTAGPAPLIVSSLGRYVISGNSAAHLLKLVDATSGNDIPGAVTSINTSGATPGTFVYGALPSPVTLAPNTTYFVLSQEALGGDQWYDYPSTTAQTAPNATLSGAVFGTGSPYTVAVLSEGRMFGPVDFKYVAISVSPATASLTVSETQQFTATGAGISNNVSWSLSPVQGSISASGLYTAPASISSIQTVTVTATSTVDSALVASAVLTLNQQAGISQQPQNITAFVGQAATFSVVTTGQNLTYQWQSMPAGGGGFSNIAGAVSISYSTPVLALADNGTQYRCLVNSASQGLFTSSAATLTVLSPGANFVTSKISGTLRNNASGWFGMSITVGARPLTVTSLGRIVATGNSGTHSLKLVDATTGIDIPGATASVNTAGGTAGNFVYAVLPGPITLNANGTYYLLSQETSGGDSWYDLNSSAQTTTDAAISAAVSGGPPYVSAPSSAGHSYGPLDFTYLAFGVGPTTANVFGGQTQQFTVTTAGIATTANWKISPQTGSISSTGLYTAPAVNPATQTVTVTATSTLDPALSATATITLVPVTITLAPPTVSLFVSQTQQFTPTVQGSGNTAVTWAITPNNAGSVSASGLYTAPATITAQQTVTITATSVADPTQSASSVITLVPVTVGVTPPTVTLFGGQTNQFTANLTGTNNTAVTWSASPSNVGAISAGGLYSAPASIVAIATVTITATSVADPNKSGTATVTLSPDPPSITQQPVNVTAYVGDTATFSVTASGPNLSYQWQSKASGAGSFSNIAGAVSSSYTTGSGALTDTGTQFRCVVTNPQGSVNSNGATLTVLSPGDSFVTSTVLGTLRNNFTGFVGMSIAVGNGPLVVRTLGRMAAPGNTATHTVKFVSAATLLDIPGGGTTINTAGATAGTFVYHSLPSPITLSPNTTYYLVSQETTNGDQFYDNNTTAQTTADGTLAASVFGDGTTYSAIPGTIGRLYVPLDFKYTSMSVTPATVSLTASQTQQYAAAVTGISNTNVTWAISPAVGAISPTGLYTAPNPIASAQIITVTATSVVDPSKSGTASITLVPVSVAASPQGVILFATQTQQFSANVTGTPNTSVTWSISPSNAGAISAGGLYTAPASVGVSQQVTVTATSAADPTMHGSVALTLSPPAPPTITQQPQPALANVGQTSSFSVTAAGVGLSYQWESMPAGTAVFNSIAGATSNSYTTPPAALADNGTQFHCVVTNAQGSVTSNAATLTVAAPTTNFVTSTTLGGFQNDFTGWVGMSMTVGNTPLTVSSVGRIVAPNNTATHTVKIVDASTGIDVPGSAGSVATLGGTVGTYAYATLANPVTLNANTTYYVLSQEIKNGELWYDANTIAQTTNVATLNGQVFGTGAPYTPPVPASPGHMYVPVDFSYKLAVTVTVAPPTASLYASETQQFSATVTGNTPLAWSISPTIGTISSNGLYTAPAVVSSSQTVIVKVTSLADITKFATATVTLNPPSAPSFTQQPQNATAFAGQTASFSVAAIGGALTYQWQSKTSGAGTFSPIAGATSSTYTTPALLQSANGTQYRCVVSNSQGTATSNPALLTVFASGSSYVLSTVLGSPRANFTGSVGMSITVGPSPLIVNSLGRIVAAGNSANHTVKIVDSAGNDVPGASVSVATSGGTVGSFVYTALAAPVTLAANATYVIVSQETQGGDVFYDSNTTAQTTADAVLNGAVFSSGTSYSLVPSSAGHLYVPVDLKYVVAVSVAVNPPTASLSASQTQQFTATVTGNANTAVTWSVSPSLGSVSASGLYTAPSVVSTSQTVTVTATSVVDGTKSASAAVTLVPVAVAVTPPSAVLFNSQTQQFTATVTGSANTAVTWTINPSNAGSISAAGLYTAPASITVTQPVTVTATSAADGTKNGTGAITLSPPSAPSISQQPQSVTVVVGKTASFSVAATGGGVTYQWQSKAVGAGSFTPIAGAVASSFVTPVTTAADDGSQFRCVVTNSLGSVTSNAAALTLLPQPLNFLTSVALGGLQNDFTGWIGMRVAVSSTPLVVYSLGRIVAPGNTSAHVVKIVDGSTGVDVPGASASITTLGGTVGTFSYTALASPVTLNANSTYFVLSQEVKNGENWYDGNTTVQTTNAGVLNAIVYGTGAPYSVVPNPGTATFGPLDFTYTGPIFVNVTPPTATIFAAQTQQFTANVIGAVNGAVNWTLSPNTGTITAAGLYTAPAVVAAAQTVTVTAASVVDPTKTATAAITLTPPAPPAITQQPASATIVVGQTTTFSLTATGPGLTYQWQSMAPGAGTFSPIAGAVANSYNVPPATVADNGTQFRCVVTNAQGSVTSNVVTLSVVAPGSKFLVSPTLGHLENDFTGWVGMSMTTGPAPIIITSLGRIIGPNNTGQHTVKIVDATSGVDVAGASALIDTTGGTAGTFVYVALGSPVTLSANTTYYVVSQETANGDQWYDATTLTQTTNVAVLNGPVFGTPYLAVASTGHLYVPVDFSYIVPVSVTLSPTTADLFASQTQQFTPTVAGSSNSAVTWSINPNVGTISGAGLYTAPATISALQTVTVTATSVADSAKFATATVTLHPPSPPAISQPPQNVTVFAGQTATFSVTAGGGGLSYQWQSMLPGAGSFNPIPGAIAGSYTTAATSLTDNGTQFRCVVTNAQGSVTSTAATLTVLAAGNTFVTAKTLGSLRNNFGGWVGMKITVGGLPLVVSSLGRIAAPGNTGAHVVKVVDAATGNDLTGASVSINTAGATAGSFVYAGLVNALVLNANTSYYIVSQEVLNGDSFYDIDTVEQTTADAVLTGPVYGTPYVPSSSAGHPYVPVDFVYNITVLVTAAPSTASLFAGQTQQFTSTVTGNANTAVTWSISPAGTGTISAAGLYTAPATIASVQTVTVTATSVADASKSASAVVTLNPPAPPAITGQPQSTTVSAGQSATFTVAATGGGLTYQWQSQPSGGSFGNIAGAVASSYTTPVTVLGDNGTQFRCVVTNAQGNVTSNAATMTVVAAGTTFITGKTLGRQRNDFGGLVGMKITVGALPLTVSSLGRLVAPGNQVTHAVKIVDAATGTDVAGGSVTVATFGGTVGTFAYTPLANPVVLTAGASYYIVSQEGAGIDFWYDNDTVVQTTTDATLAAAVYSSNGTYIPIAATVNHPYVPLDFKYTASVVVTISPTTASLSGGQTQQFTSTVTGNANTAVTWSLTPAGVGTVSAAGLYTAPATIASVQTVTVTATSVADVSKSAPAVVTLNPPAPPAITQQPQSASVVVGQTGTFTVAATGGGLTYQWQSQPSGAGTFGNIAGAVASSYTTPVTVPGDNGTQFRCVVTNAQGSVNSNAATMAVVAAGTNFITGKTLGRPRSDFTGWVGMQITVGALPLTVSSVGRIVAPGNAGTHTVKIVNAATGNDVSGGSALVNTSTGTTGSFIYTALTSPVVLAANTAYFMVSQEQSGGDTWYDLDSTVQTTTDAVLNAPVYGLPLVAIGGLANHPYVPLDFKYTAAVVVTVAPPTASLSGGQTQQFTSTLTGNANTAVTWSLSPAGTGTISAAGLYTAPVTIVSVQTVTVTATSVADPSKSASAVVTLNPPAPPAITQQPQSASVTVGQSATFTVAATGGGLAYQWQSQPLGGNSFGNIAGAVASSYTTPVTALGDNGTQFRCVVTNTQGSVTSNAATLAVAAAGTTFITGKTLGRQRNDFGGLVGMKITVGALPLTVSSLGRLVAPGNQVTHLVKIVDATGTDVAGGAVSVATFGVTTGTFAYTPLANPVVLTAGASYYIVSQEGAGIDYWYDDDTTVQTTTDATLGAAVYNANGTYIPIAATVNHPYVPLDFKYTASVVVTVSPTTASLSGGQTQQFTSTVTGNANTAVTWSLTPAGVGTVSAAGLYTAPATIASVQTVTVTATSVADASKSASAVVTLNPPAPPAITGQPQSASVTVGQTGTFTVAATGGGLTYQWQSQPSGGSFGNIAGAVASSYTTAVTTLGDNGTQFRCVVTNAQGSVTSSAATMTVTAAGANFITAKTLGRQRNDFGGLVGMKITVGAVPLTVSSLGRLVAPGNQTTHAVKIVDAAGNDVAGGGVTVATFGGTVGTFAYASLASPVVLTAGASYFIVSQEGAGIDYWYDDDTTVQTTADATLVAAVYSANGPYIPIAATANHPYVPLDFKYTASLAVTVSPTTASLSGGQTQQFTSTVTGNANTAVTWSLNPAGTGTVSGAGLYTAPATIASLQTVTVTATSVADPSKSASAVVTLNPPAPPAITQQPQSTSIVVGQTGTFTVAATGGGLTYQWQSQPSGAGSFANIAGAVASSYTTPVTVLGDNGTQFRCTVTNAQGSVNSNPATMTVVAGGLNFVTGKTLGRLRNDFGGWVGMQITVGAVPLTVSSLGRLVAPGNQTTHAVKIVDAAGNDVAGGGVSVVTFGGTTGTFAYTSLATPVVLTAGATYYIVSQEGAGIDYWYDNDTTVQTTADATVADSAYNANGTYTPIAGTAGRSYVPVDFKYTPGH